MSNYEVDPNIKQILDLKINKGVFPLTVDSAVIAHSPNGETTYLDSVVDYLYQLIANKLRLYTELDGAYTKGKAYPATMGVQNANNINALLGTVNNYASILSALQQQVNDIDPTDDITSINNTILRLWGILNNLSEASEYSYQEIKFSDSLTVPPNDLDNTTYWKTRPMDNPQHLWLGIRTITIKRGEDGRPIITKGDTMVVSLQGPKGEKGERGADGTTGSAGTPGKSYRPVLMYKWTESRTSAPATPTDPRNLGWTESPNNPVGENKYLWMTLNHLDVSNNTYINPTWSTPVCLSGEDGVGSDGKGVEFIYFLSSSPNIPSVESLNRYYYNEDPRFQQDDFPFGEDGVPIVSTDGWTDNPTGITLEYQYEYASFREGNAGNWKPFSDPFLWSRWGENGIDGDGVEYIYFTSTGEKEWPESVSYTDPMSEDPRAWTNLDGFQDDDFIPTLLLNEWFDEPQELDPIYTHQYVSMRKKIKVGKVKKWGAYTMPKLWNLYSGAGDRYVMLYQWTVVRLSPELPTSQGLGNWTESPGNSNNLYLWMIGGYAKAEDNYDSGYTTVSLWSAPVCLSGKDGVGTDGTGIEFIFFRTNDINANPNVNDLNAYKNGTSQEQEQFQAEDFPFIGPNSTNIVPGNLWTDNPQGIESTAKYEWASFRLSSGGAWDSFCAPFRWSMWGEDGIDGDGVEYIYYRCNNGNRWTDVPQSEDPVLPKALPSESNFQSDDPADPRTWSNDPNFQNPEFIKSGLKWDGLPNTLGWSDDPRGVTENNMYEYVSSRKKEPDPNNPRKKIWGEYSKPVLWAKFGKNGEPGSAAEQGLSGPVVRFRGEYDSSIPGTDNPYINSSLNTDLPPTAIRYIDVVYVDANGQKTYYMVKPQLGGTRQPTTAPTSSSEDWEEAVGYSFIAAEALYAHNAHIDNLSGYEFVVLDLSNYTVAGMTGGNIANSVVNNNYLDNPVRIWAGSRATNNINLQGENIPFKVFQDGKLKATNAEIKGNLSIDSLLLTGNEGSYYYNKSAITLPKIDNDNHKVIFIITAEKQTIVSAYTGDVLFAFSNNSMQTTTSTTLSTYKIYLAISINNGLDSGWLLLNLNALELLASMGTVSRDIIEDLVVENGYWTIYSDVHNNLMKLYLRRDLGNIYSFTTINTSSYPSATNPVFSIQGDIDFETENGDHITTLHLDPIEPQGISNLGREELSGYVTMGSIIDTYNGHENDTPKKIYLDGNGWTIHVYSNPNDHTLDYIEISMPLKESIDEGTPIKVTHSISLTESFNYLATTNYSTPTTTSIVGSNGFIIKDGSIVATDMPEGASVNMKDCIVYKDVTGTDALEQYEVINFGASNVTIGNTTLNSKDSVIIKALPNAHIDFSDVAAINVDDIDVVDYVQHGDPVNH